MIELTSAQVSILERLISDGFAPVAFPLYANAVGLRRGNCATLLEPVPNHGFRIFGEPCVVLDGNLTVRITDNGKLWFVWKKLRVEATPDRLAELEAFAESVRQRLESEA